MNTVAILQARMKSTRLPGKVLAKVMNRPLLQYQVERLRQARSLDEICIATTDTDADTPIVEQCAQWGVHCCRGSETDVLARYHGAALTHRAEAVVRITADCPLIDPAIVDRVVQFYQANASAVDYVSNILERTFPRGLDCEVFPMRILTLAFQEARQAAEREHVTPFIYSQPNRFRLRNIAYPTNMNRYRWTVDTPEDFELIKRMLEALYPGNPNFTLEDSLRMIQAHPDWEALNSHIEQKPVRA